MNSDRYVRQIVLPAFGEDGQTVLEDSSVLVIGCGGVGTTILYDLAAMGIGTIGLADHEIVKVSNLNRQFIHFEEDVGSLKVLSASKKLKQFNSEINIIPHATAINKDNAYEIISQYDMVALCVDNAQARMIVNEACVALNKPFVYGAANGTIGSCCFIEPGKTPCLACLYGTETPVEEHFPNLAPVVSTIGSLAATCIAQKLLGKEVPITGELIYFNAETFEMEKVALEEKPDCPICGTGHKDEE